MAILSVVKLIKKKIGFFWKAKSAKHSWRLQKKYVCGMCLSMYGSSHQPCKYFMIKFCFVLVCSIPKYIPNIIYALEYLFIF